MWGVEFGTGSCILAERAKRCGDSCHALVAGSHSHEAIVKLHVAQVRLDVASGRLEDLQCAWSPHYSPGLAALLRNSSQPDAIVAPCKGLPDGHLQANVTKPKPLASLVNIRGSLHTVKRVR